MRRTTPPRRPPLPPSPSAWTTCWARASSPAGSRFYKPTMKLLPHPPASTQLYKLGKGKLHDVVKLMANCLEQKGTMRAMSRGEYDGLVAANEPPAPEFSPRRVLKNYGDMTTSEFQSHLIKLDTTFRGDKALNTGARRTRRTSSCTCRAGPSCSSASNSRTTSCKRRACWCRAIANFW